MKESDRLKVKIGQHVLPNPVGNGAGIDRVGAAVDGLFDIGFGFVEVGSMSAEIERWENKPAQI